MKIKAKYIVLLGAFIVLTLLGYYFLPKDEILIQTDVENKEENLLTEEDIEIERIFVHIEGAINFPGIKEVEKGTRLFELIEIAGGTTIDADTSKINLASILKDEQKIYVPFRVSEDKNRIDNSETIKIEKDNELININNANVKELQSLDGIGPSMAEKIINYREENGFFSSIEELQNVSGIGNAKYNKIKERITI